MRGVTTIAVITALAATACGPSRETVAGWVVDIGSTSVTDVESITLRTAEGEEQVYRIGTVELDGDAFPPSHLREHMALAQPVALSFEEVGSERVVVRLVDAPWLRASDGGSAS